MPAVRWRWAESAHAWWFDGGERKAGGGGTGVRGGVPVRVSPSLAAARGLGDAGDAGRLDGDSDGVACEGLPVSISNHLLFGNPSNASAYNPTNFLILQRTP